eukprot:1029417-Prymnesium_polylepis.1
MPKSCLLRRGGGAACSGGGARGEPTVRRCATGRRTCERRRALAQLLRERRRGAQWQVGVAGRARTQVDTLRRARRRDAARGEHSERVARARIHAALTGGGVHDRRAVARDGRAEAHPHDELGHGRVG